ncbi:MAG: carboxypeptidase-like regulatory domain-containing protein, partial [Terriglobia bacterium]|nr:carboxypeptidase-like regulatory domain-containing protein [Terriglobia bacterium]
MMWRATAVAQFTTARLSGTVTDKAGAAVAGATVSVDQVTTGYKQTAKTGSAGEYLFPSLPIGSYEMTVEMPGFSAYVQQGIVLTVGQAASQNVTLAVGATAQQVTVRANPSMV